MTTNQHVVPSEWAPLQIAAFRAIWFASLAANVGTWFQNVGGVWLMTSFTASPLLIALMQTATTLPVFLVGFPAGALADIVNRRRRTEHPDLYRAHERAPAAGLHLCARPGRDPGESGLASGQRGTRSTR